MFVLKPPKTFATARIKRVPRILTIFQHKVSPITDKKDTSSPVETNERHHSSLPSVSVSDNTQNQSNVLSMESSDAKQKDTVFLSMNGSVPESSPTNITYTSEPMKDANQQSISCFKSLTSKQKLLLKLLIAILIILAVTAAVVVPVYFFVLRPSVSPQSSLTNVSVSACSTTTCIYKETPYHSSTVTAFYPFDGSSFDSTGYASGTPYGSSSISYTNQAYIGQAALLQSSLSQYFAIPYINLAQQSFTIEMWLMPYLLVGTVDAGIFCQCDSNAICLTVSLRNYRVTLSFDSMNTGNITLTGTSILSPVGWTHVAVVYDAVLFQQRIYVNGQIDAVSSGIVYPYQGSSSTFTTTIGKTSSFAYPSSYFSGRIDQFTITSGIARNACQISNDASLVAFFPFETTGTYNDYSVNLCNGIALGTIATSGRVGQALAFTSNTSYFQAQCFPKMRSAELSFSVSLWINPNSTAGGTLVHISNTASGTGNCYDLLTLTSSGSLVFQYLLGNLSVFNNLGPVITVNVWTHIVFVYGAANGVRLYINGQFSASSVNIANLYLQDTSSPLYITLGNVGSLGTSAMPACSVGPTSISPGYFSGAIDQFRLYNRQLDNQEICMLANP